MSSTRTDETPVYGPGESFKTGSSKAEMRREALVDWLLTPESEREPKTKQAFADAWGVTRQTIFTDLRDPMVQREVGKRARAAAKVDRLPDVIDSLYDIATGKAVAIDHRTGEVKRVADSASVSAAKVLLSWMDQTEQVRTQIDFSELSEEEITQAVIRLLQKRDDAKS